MEETLGKRIAAHRKELGLTQDRLAELLGITPQAVSKWENNQSCPDIAILPRLAEIFGITVDELLGMKPSAVQIVEKVPESGGSEPAEGFQAPEGAWEFQWDGGQKSTLFFALWILLCGGLLLLSGIAGLGVGFWDILWPTGLLLFGLFGLYPRFSFFRLGCGLFGAYSLLNRFHITPFEFGRELLLPVFLVLFGLSLLVDALRKPKKGNIHIHRSGKNAAAPVIYSEDSFACETSFGENTCLIQMPRMAGGSARLSFGELTADLRGCGEIVSGSAIALDCSFGDLTLLVPKSCRVEPACTTTFASVDVEGSPVPEACATLYLRCHANFGQIIIRYV